MKRQLTVVLMVTVFCLVGVVQAATIDSINIAQFNGVSTLNTAGTLTWANGAIGTVITDGFNFGVSFDVSCTGTFTGMNDISVDPLARATFDTGTFEMIFNHGGDARLTLNGSLSSLYNEGEIADGVQLDGLAVVNLSATIDSAYWASQWGVDEVYWGGPAEDGLGALQTQIILLSGISDYLSGYSSDNLSVTMYADQTAVPEPATMSILGLGSLLLLRRRKA